MSNQNAHKPGYKHTPLGWIPEEWEVVRVEDVAQLNPSRKILSDEEDVSFLAMADVSEEGNVINGFVQKYGQVKNGFTYFENDDILVAKITPCFENGKGALVRNLKNGVGFGSTEFHVIRAGKSVIPDYIFYHTRLYNFRGRGRQNMTGSAGQQRVPTDFIETYKFPLPPLPQQRCIAAILSTWDEAITKTRQLITQLQQRNKGLMQQLLTGRKRLQGFEGEWNEIHLSDAFTERNETGYVNLELLSVGSFGIYPQSQSEKRDISNADKSKYKRICPGDIGYNTMRMWQGRSALSQLEGIVSPAYTIVIPKANQSSLFYSFLFKLPSVVHKFFRNSQGLVEDTLNCKFKDFALVKVKVPDYGEQIAIANVLTKANAEVRLYEQKLAVLQQQKKGLMQKLLTGEVRVKS